MPAQVQHQSIAVTSHRSYDDAQRYPPLKVRPEDEREPSADQVCGRHGHRRGSLTALPISGGVITRELVETDRFTAVMSVLTYERTPPRHRRRRQHPEGSGAPAARLRFEANVHVQPLRGMPVFLLDDREELQHPLPDDVVAFVVHGYSGFRFLLGGAQRRQVHVHCCTPKVDIKRHVTCWESHLAARLLVEVTRRQYLNDAFLVADCRWSFDLITPKRTGFVYRVTHTIAPF